MKQGEKPRGRVWFALGIEDFGKASAFFLLLIIAHAEFLQSRDQLCNGSAKWTSEPFFNRLQKKSTCSPIFR